jgi:hypothetical protein
VSLPPEYFREKYGRCAFNPCPCLQQEARNFNAGRILAEPLGPGTRCPNWTPHHVSSFDELIEIAKRR